MGQVPPADRENVCRHLCLGPWERARPAIRRIVVERWRIEAVRRGRRGRVPWSCRRSMSAILRVDDAAGVRARSARSCAMKGDVETVDAAKPVHQVTRNYGQILLDGCTGSTVSRDVGRRASAVA
jgi:hypothetical protein